MPRKTANTIVSRDGKEKEFRLSPKAEAFNLAIHGTEPAKLSANNLIQAAEADLRNARFNDRIRAELRKPRRERDSIADEPIRPYTFGAFAEFSSSSADILNRAIDARDHILGLSIADQDDREEHQRRLSLSTLRAYLSVDVLREAATIASAPAAEIAA